MSIPIVTVTVIVMRDSFQKVQSPKKKPPYDQPDNSRDGALGPEPRSSTPS